MGRLTNYNQRVLSAKKKKNLGQAETGRDIWGNSKTLKVMVSSGGKPKKKNESGIKKRNGRGKEE